MADTELALSIIGAVAGIASVVVAIVVWKAQERQQRLIAELTLRAHLVDLGKQLGQHLTEWEEALRDAVASNDTDRFNRFRDSVSAFRDHLVAIQSNVTYFQDGERFQGPLEPMLAELDRYPECASITQAAREFEAIALDFKDGIAASLGDMITGHGPYGEMRRNDPAAFAARKDELFSRVRNAYRAVMIAIRDFTATAP